MGEKLSSQEKDAAARAITKAIAYAENGGAPNLSNPSVGKSGEMKSIFQYTPDTWHAVAAKYLGDANTQLNPENETTATLARVSHWLDEGYNAAQIASMWNAGEGRPNAYKENWKGTNSYGVSYNTPEYAKEVNNYAKQFYQQMTSLSPDQQQSNNQQSTEQNTNELQNTNNNPTRGLSSSGLLPSLAQVSSS